MQVQSIVLSHCTNFCWWDKRHSKPFEMLVSIPVLYKSVIFDVIFKGWIRNIFRLRYVFRVSPNCLLRTISVSHSHVKDINSGVMERFHYIFFLLARARLGGIPPGCATMVSSNNYNFCQVWSPWRWRTRLRWQEVWWMQQLSTTAMTTRDRGCGWARFSVWVIPLFSFGHIQEMSWKGDVITSTMALWSLCIWSRYTSHHY